jgi:hypothetical protein
MYHLLNRVHSTEPPSTNQASATAEVAADHLQLRKDEYVIGFTENSSMQAKVVKGFEHHVQERTLGKKLFDKCWKDLDLPSFIAAFSKEEKGGSYWLGLEDEKLGEETKWKESPQMTSFLQFVGSGKKCWTDNEGKILYIADAQDVPVESGQYRTGKFKCRGVVLSEENKEEFRQELQTHVENNMFWYKTAVPSGAGAKEKAASQHLESFVNCKFHEVQRRATSPPRVGPVTRSSSKSNASTTKTQSPPKPKLYAIEIRIKHFPGVCFQTEQGPEAYTLNVKDSPRYLVSSSPDRITPAECCSKLQNWLQDVQQSCKAAVS